MSDDMDDLRAVLRGERKAEVEWRDPAPTSGAVVTKWADLFGIDPDFTEGKPVDEWLDEQRGEA